jgi:hypothetical protein
MFSSDQKFADYWFEIDDSCSEEFIAHLQSHCLRKKVDIQDMSNFMNVYGAIVTKNNFRVY